MWPALTRPKSYDTRRDSAVFSSELAVIHKLWSGYLESTLEYHKNTFWMPAKHGGMSQRAFWDLFVLWSVPYRRYIAHHLLKFVFIYNFVSLLIQLITYNNRGVGSFHLQIADRVPNLLSSCIERNIVNDWKNRKSTITLYWVRMQEIASHIKTSQCDPQHFPTSKMAFSIHLLRSLRISFVWRSKHRAVVPNPWVGSPWKLRVLPSPPLFGGF